MKIYIMTDLEGTAGVVDFESQTYPSGKYFEIAKGLATEEVNSACEGAFEAGIEEIFVVDGHGSGGIIPEKFILMLNLSTAGLFQKHLTLSKDGMLLF